ncbi:hypothetical protein N7456_002417 [Penicillium angulare]|uniref:NACHT domain-containing protein n=1 Tax=Penicillium angulare TaxID=116970 RepID=A0A9W9G8M5_9EURO|nr:hypothetical protein N7456_002417 [Penicillium angulare]
MHTSYPQLNNSEYAVGWLTALPHERAAAESMLDEKHAPPQSKSPTGPNNYTLGSINGPTGKHNVVIACLPAGRYGTTAAATAAAGMISSFPQIKFGLMVGIGGGIPSDENDIRLGDVVVSKPEGSFGGVRQYDCGKVTPQGFEERGSLNSPPTVLLNAVNALQSKHDMVGSEMPDFLDTMRKNYPLMAKPRQGPGYVYQGEENDCLFDSAYEHPSDKKSCQGCDASKRLRREARGDQDPYIFYGTIASGNSVIKDSRLRDIFSHCLCFEMEAAGLMNNFPCLVIRGICDYCDTHKNDQWQKYAAATAAAYAKELIQITDVEDVQNASEVRGLTDEVRNIHETLKKTEKRSSESEDRRRRQVLGAVDPVNDKKRIEDTKGGLLQGSYKWVLNNEGFKKWKSTDNDQLLCIKGPPGQGKTMLICGIIDELSAEVGPDTNIAYFFCQATIDRINNGPAVLRGLVHMIVEHQISLVNHIPDDLSENENAWFQMQDVFLNILADKALRSTYIIIDALDECVTDLDKLLRLLAMHSSKYPQVKWLVSSRNWQNIRETLETSTKLTIDLELHEQSLSDAIKFFINHKVKELAQTKGYREEERDIVHRHLELNAKGTFLWVALSPWRSRYSVSRMFDNIDNSNDADDAKLCISLLGIVTTVYRPITLDEMRSLLQLPNSMTGAQLDDDCLGEIIGLCGSFLLLQKRTITLVHQSAQDFLQQRVSRQIHPHGKQATHHSIFLKSLKALQSRLQRDICGLDDPTISIDEVKQPSLDQLAEIEYACIYWVDHLKDHLKPERNYDTEIGGQLRDMNMALDFMCNDLLHWIEALCLMKSLSTGATSMFNLESAFKTNEKASDLVSWAQDAYRFIIYHKTMIENHPLQVYTSAIFFTPRSTKVRHQFETDDLKWINSNKFLEESWGECLQTLDGGNDVNSVAISYSGEVLVSSGHLGMIKIWNFRSGQCIRTLESPAGSVYELTFSPHDTLLVSACGGGFDIWQTHDWQCIHTIHGSTSTSVKFSPSKAYAALADYSKIGIWDINTWKCLKTLASGKVYSVAFSPDGKILASSHSSAICIWDTDNWQCLETIKIDSEVVTAVAFSPDIPILISGFWSGEIQIWDSNNWQLVQRLESHKGCIKSVVFSNDGSKFASCCSFDEIKVWNTNSYECIQTPQGHQSNVNSVVFSKDDMQLVSGSSDRSVKVWDLQSNQHLSNTERQYGIIESVDFSPDGALFASGSTENNIKVWNSHSGMCLRTIETHCDRLRLVTFSPDGKLLISGDHSSTVQVWESHSWQQLRTLEGHRGYITSVVFSMDGTLLASSDEMGGIKVWNTQTWECLQTMETNPGENYIRSMVFSPDRKLFAHAVTAKTGAIIKIWDICNWHSVKVLSDQLSSIKSVAFCPGGRLVAYGTFNASDETIRAWECLQKQGEYGSRIKKVYGVERQSQTHREFFTRVSSLDSDSACFPMDQGFGVSDDQTWITWNSRKVLKLPSVYISDPYGSFLYSVALSDSGIGIGCHSGQVILLESAL